MKENNQYEEYIYDEEEEKKRKYMWILLFVAAFFLLFIVIGISFSVFDSTITGEKTPIEPGENIIFNYTDTSDSGNGVHLKNARETSDAIGKKLLSDASYFDFTVSGKTNKSIRYSVLLEADQTSTLSYDDVKIYLTKVSGNYEQEISSLVPVYSSLEDIKIDDVVYKKVYTFEFDNSDSSFSHEYRLRMWIKEGAANYYLKSFKAKVHIFAEGDGE